MHRWSDLHKALQLYSGHTHDEQLDAADWLANHPEVARTIQNLNEERMKKVMQRARDSRILAATTKDMRDIARDAHRRDLNRQMKPAQFKLLDPKGTHIISPQFFHDRADGKLVEMHCRCNVSLKLIGKKPAVELMMDISMEFIEEYLTGQEKIDLMDRALAQGSVENIDGDDNPLKQEVIDLETLKQGNESTPNADALMEEWNAAEEGGMSLGEIAAHRQKLQDMGLVEEAGPDPDTGEMRYRAVKPSDEVVKRSGKAKKRVSYTPRTTARDIVGKAQAKAKKENS